MGRALKLSVEEQRRDHMTGWQASHCQRHVVRAGVPAGDGETEERAATSSGRSGGVRNDAGPQHPCSWLTGQRLRGLEDMARPQLFPRWRVTDLRPR